MKALLISAGVLASGAILCAGDSLHLFQLQPPVNDRTDTTQAIEVAKKLKTQRDETIEHLMRVVTMPANDGVASNVRGLAIELLGDYRASEAVGLLVENIEYKVVKPNFEATRASAYPAVLALRDIGLPSITAIVSCLDSSRSDNEMKLFATVFRFVDGADLAVLRADLAMERADGQQKKNLERLVELLKANRWYF